MVCCCCELKLPVAFHQLLECEEAALGLNDAVGNGRLSLQNSSLAELENRQSN